MKNNEPNLIIKPKSTKIHHNRPTPSTQPNCLNSSNLREIIKPLRKPKSNNSEIIKTSTIRSTTNQDHRILHVLPQRLQSNPYPKTTTTTDPHDQTQIPPPPRRSYNSRGSLPHRTATPQPPPLVEAHLPSLPSSHQKQKQPIKPQRKTKESERERNVRKRKRRQGFRKGRSETTP